MLGPRIADERRRLGWSQKDLAERLGVGRSAVGMLETDRSPLDAERLIQLGADGVDVLYVLTGERSSIAAGHLIDWELCVAIMQRIHEWSLRRKVRLPAAKQAAIIKLVYLQAAARGALDERTFEQTVGIAA
jgi:transcriptional regulator with XRE-family HTH domain